MLMTRFSHALATGAILAFLAAAPAFAQGGVATVNGEPITGRDIDQRMRVMGTLFRQPLSRQAALEQLIDDKVKGVEARRLGMRVTEAHQNEMMTRLAGSVRQQPTQFEQNLSKAGIEPEAVRAKITADAIWGELVRQRGRNNVISNAELNEETEKRVAKGEARVTDYVVRQVVFVVPPGVGIGQRERDANAARGRVSDCESGVEYLRTLRDVAVKERIGRTSADLSKQTTDLLQKTPIGRMTAPARSDQGVEMLLVCEKNDRQDVGRLRQQIEQELQQKRTQGNVDGYLKELRAKVDIRR
jgi:peptidyl-prolyl cis-trans isomerase SurA